MHGGVIFFHHPREIPWGEMSIPIVFSMSNSLYFLSLHILKDVAGDLPCNQIMSCFHLCLLAKGMVCSSVLNYICVPVSLWLLVQNLCGCLKGSLPGLWHLQPVPGLLDSHHALLQCFRIPDSAVSTPLASGYGPHGSGAGQQKSPSLPTGHGGISGKIH